jgi:hypothetical protein
MYWSWKRFKFLCKQHCEDEEMIFVIQLGALAKDKITGFEGIITGHVKYLYGCDQYGLTPPAKDGKIGDTQYFDEGRIEIIGRGILPEEVKTERPGGINRDCPR